MNSAPESTLHVVVTGASPPSVVASENETGTAFPSMDCTCILAEHAIPSSPTRSVLSDEGAVGGTTDDSEQAAKINAINEQAASRRIGMKVSLGKTLRVLLAIESRQRPRSPMHHHWCKSVQLLSNREVHYLDISLSDSCCGLVSTTSRTT